MLQSFHFIFFLFWQTCSGVSKPYTNKPGLTRACQISCPDHDLYRYTSHQNTLCWFLPAGIKEDPAPHQHKKKKCSPLQRKNTRGGVLSCHRYVPLSSLNIFLSDQLKLVMKKKCHKATETPACASLQGLDKGELRCLSRHCCQPTYSGNEVRMCRTR